MKEAGRGVRGDARADRSVGVDWGERKLEEPCGDCGVDGMYDVSSVH